MQSPTEIAKQVFPSLVPGMDNILAVTVGGSVGRGEHIVGSDIDILYFHKTEQRYRKEFSNIDGWPIEIHIIPEALPSFMVTRISPLFETPAPANNEFFALDPNILGAKQCPFDLEAASPIRGCLSTWREMRKMLDSVVLWQKDQWFEQFNQTYSSTQLKYAEIKRTLSSLTEEADTMNSVLDAFRIEAILSRKVLSKAMWVDRYLHSHIDQRLYELSLKFFRTPHGLINEIIPYVTELVGDMLRSRDEQEFVCQVCYGEIEQCQLGRSSMDYLHDAKRAFMNDWTIGAFLSLQRAEINARLRLTSAGYTLHRAPQRWESFLNKKLQTGRQALGEIVKEIIRYHRL